MANETTSTTSTTRQETTAYTDLINKYRSDYGDRWAEQEAAKIIANVAQAVAAKDFSYLVHLRHVTNGFSREVFTRISGVKLHRTQRESLRILQDFVGPEQVVAYQQQHEAERVKREAQRLKRLVGVRQVNAEGYGLLDMDAFIEALVTSGYTSIIEQPRGAARVWFLCNAEGRGYTFRRSIEHQYIEHLLEQRQAESAATQDATGEQSQSDSHTDAARV